MLATETAKILEAREDFDPGRVCSVRPKRANRAPSTIGAPLDADDVASGASSIQRRRDRRCDRVRRSPDRIVVEVCVAGGRLDRWVPEKLPNYGQPETSSSADAGEAVAQVVQPEALDASPPRDDRQGCFRSDRGCVGLSPWMT